MTTNPEPRTCHWRRHSFLLSHFTSNLLNTEQDYASVFVGLCWFIAPWFDLPPRLYSIFHPWKLILVELTIFYKLQFVFYIKIDKQYLICLLVSSAHVNSHEYNSEVSAKRICNICIKTPYANFLYLCISRSSERCFLFGSVKVYNLDRGIGPIFFCFLLKGNPNSTLFDLRIHYCLIRNSDSIQLINQTETFKGKFYVWAAEFLVSRPVL